MKELKLTDSQYRSLLKLVYLGAWMAETQGDDAVPELDSVEQYIYSRAADFGCDDMVNRDGDTGELYPSDEFMSSMEFYIDDYNDEVLWDDLALLLARRDLVKKLGEKKVMSMSEEELIRAGEPFMERYMKEFEENGIMNLVLGK